MRRGVLSTTRNLNRWSAWDGTAYPSKQVHVLLAKEIGYTLIHIFIPSFVHSMDNSVSGPISTALIIEEETRKRNLEKKSNKEQEKKRQEEKIKGREGKTHRQSLIISIYRQRINTGQYEVERRRTQV